eukprot:m.173896 g.173896  ORF g.173896 m.173896 type:complete len:62 (-) comp24336_c0_seq12:2403-2588(-)
MFGWITLHSPNANSAKKIVNRSPPSSAAIKSHLPSGASTCTCTKTGTPRQRSNYVGMEFCA